MAATFTSDASGGGMPSAPLWVERVSFAGDSNYPTGGYAIDSALTDNRTLVAVLCEGDTGGDGDIAAIYDHANDKVQLFVPSTGAEVAGSTDVSNVALELVLLYK